MTRGPARARTSGHQRDPIARITEGGREGDRGRDKWSDKDREREIDGEIGGERKQGPSHSKRTPRHLYS